MQNRLLYSTTFVWCHLLFWNFFVIAWDVPMSLRLRKWIRSSIRISIFQNSFLIRLWIDWGYFTPKFLFFHSNLDSVCWLGIIGFRNDYDREGNELSIKKWSMTVAICYEYCIRFYFWFLIFFFRERKMRVWGSSIFNMSFERKISGMFWNGINRLFLFLYFLCKVMFL